MVAVVLAMVVLTMSASLLSWNAHRRHVRNKAHDFEMNKEDVAEIMASDDSFETVLPREIKRRHVTLVEEIGAGNFGVRACLPTIQPCARSQHAWVLH